MQKPCMSKEVLHFDIKFDNLAHFLDFLENKSNESCREITEIKTRNNNFDIALSNLKNQIPDFKKVTEGINQKINILNDKIEHLTETLNKNVHRLNDFDTRFKTVVNIFN